MLKIAASIKETRAYHILITRNGNSHLARYAGLLIRTRAYAELRKNTKTRRIMVQLFNELKQSPDYTTILELGDKLQTC